MTMRQTLAVIFSAFWERADLYTDVLALEHDNPSPRQLRLSFFRQGRIVLATPIESPDDMTTISPGVKPMFCASSNSNNNSNNSNVNNSNNSNNNNHGDMCAIQPGVKVSRKAKIKFQAINLAYDLLKDEEKRKAYDEWRLWHCRLPPPPGFYTWEEQEQQRQKHQHQHQHQQLKQQQPRRQYPQQEEVQRQHKQSRQYSFREMEERETCFSNEELNEIINAGKINSNDNNIYISDSNSNDESSAMGSSISSSSRSSISKSSLPSILREPKFGTKKKKKKKYRSSKGRKEIPGVDGNNNKSSSGHGTSTSDRRIRWNEEVEELVIMEYSRESSCTDIPHSDLPDGLPAYDPFTSFDSTKENVDPVIGSSSSSSSSSPTDPYANPSVMKNGWYENDNNNNNNHKNDRNSNAVLSSKSDVPTLSEPGISYNFHSLDDSTLTFVQPSDDHTNHDGKLDDSLIAILDAPILPPTQTKPRASTSTSAAPRPPRQWSEQVGDEMKHRKLANIHKEWENNNKSNNNSNVHIHDDNSRNEEHPNSNSNSNSRKVLVDEGTSYVLGEGSKNNVRINVRTFQKEKQISSMTLPTGTMMTPKISQDDNTNINAQVPDIFQQYQKATEFELNADDLSLDTKDTADSKTNWREFDNQPLDSYGAEDCGAYPRHDCGTFSPSNDCGPVNDCGSIDLAKGFQASLSNYINVAVADMKEGWNSLGKKWEENVPKFSEKGENPFLLNSFELDAMMDILKVEMSSIPERMNMNTASGVASCAPSDPSPFKGELPRCQPRYKD